MSWLQSVRLGVTSAGESLASHRLRSMLTLLSISLGVVGVLAVDGYGQYADAQVTRSLAQFGSNLVVVRPAPPVTRQARTGAVRTLTVDDANAMREVVPHVLALSGVKTGSVNAVADRYSWSTQALGVGAEFPSIEGLQVQSGRFLSTDDDTAASPVAVLGAEVVARLFPGVADASGRTVRLNGTDFRVVGVLAPRGQSANGNLDDIVYVPLSTAFARLYGGTSVDRIEVRIDARAHLSASIQATTVLLEERHHLLTGAPDDFQVQNYQQAAERSVAATDALAGGLVAGAGLALVVAGCGILNIMLLSVSERTPEIGVRLAVGARATDVRTQFLAEAVALCLGGAATGAAMALVGSELVSRRIGVGVVPTWPAVVLAAGIAVGIGLVFGLYPAERAGRLDPIVALRSE